MADSGEDQSGAEEDLSMEEVEDQSEHDMYIAQLKEVFDSCNQSGSQGLDRQELYILCDKLQLDDQSEYLINELLRDKDEVAFEDFKGSFVQILCQTYTSQPESEEEEEAEEESHNLGTDKTEPYPSQGSEQGSEEGLKKSPAPQEEMEEDAVFSGQTQNDGDTESEVSPKYVVGNKRYGRRSLPYSAAEELDSLADDEEDEMEEVMSSVMSSASLKHSLTVADASESDEELGETQKKRQRRQRHGSGGQAEAAETFEAEGQLNLTMADSAKQKEGEESYLRGIWDSLGVGRNGYISIEELARVCTHIGMEEMNDTQLEQLFDKLDADRDGRVSFQEFLAEMFQHHPPPPPAPPRSVGTTPTRALSAQKKIKSLAAGGEERITPSIIQGSGATGLFSALDPNKTGFAKAEAIVDLWEKYNITNGLDILMGLGFEPDTRVNLQDLSAGLEQELLGADETNMCLQAATVSYQQEMRTLKSSLEQAGMAKERLRLDLAEANARNSLLAKEVDERHASMERSSESKLLSVEKKYQDQIRALQGEVERERESLSVLQARHKHIMDADMTSLRQQEGKLREHLALVQKEVGKLSYDLEDSTCKLQESERQNHRLQRELDSMLDLHRKLSEFESAGILNPEEHTFAQEKIQRLEQDNKDLKDENDELRVELEQTKHQVGAARRTGLPGNGDGTEDQTHTPIRKDGSVLSDYIKPFIVKKASFSSADYSDDDAQVLAEPRVHVPVFLPKDDDDIRIRLFGSGNTKSRRRVSGLGSTSDNESVEQLKQQFEAERRALEEKYKLEVATVEERHDQEKHDILQHIDQQKKGLEEDFERLQEEALSELARELQTNFAHEKDDLVEKLETEKNHLKQLHAEEKQELLDRLQVEGDHNVKSKVQELKARHKEEREELEQALDDTEGRIHDLEVVKVKLEQQKVRLEDQVTQAEEQNAELEEEGKKFKKQVSELKDSLKAQREQTDMGIAQVEEEKSALKEYNKKCKKQISELKESLKSQCEKSDQEMLRQKSEMEGMLSRHLQNVADVEAEKHEHEQMYKKQQSEAERRFQEEKLELASQLEEQKEEVRAARQQLAGIQEVLTEQRGEMEVSLTQEKLKLQEGLERMRALQEAAEVREQEICGDYEEKIRELDKVGGESVQEIQEAYEEKIKELKSEAEKNEQELQEVYENRLKDLRKAAAESEQETYDLYEEKINELQRESRVSEQKLHRDYDEKIRNLQQTATQQEQELRGQFESKIKDLKTTVADKESQLAQVMDKGVEGLRGKLKEDFQCLVTSQTQEALDRERKALTDSLTDKERELQAEFDVKQSEMSHVFEKQRAELVERHEEQAAALKAELDCLQGKLEEEREALAQRYEGERESLEETLAQQIKDELEEELCDQMEEIKEAYEDTQRGFEAEAALLREEIEDLQKSLDRETKNRKQLEELRRTNITLQNDKRQAEKGHQEMQQAFAETKASLEARIDELMGERQGGVSPVKAELVEASKPSEQDKARYEAVVSEKQALEGQMTQLQQELSDLQQRADKVDTLQMTVDQLTRENTDLSGRLNQASQAATDTRSTAVPEHAQRAINELTHERAELEERLTDTESKLGEIEDMARKFTHLQFDYGQLTIGQSALEESLHDTQDRLADTEAQLYQAEKELKDARRYVDKYKLLQKKYEDVCKERDRSTALVKTLKEQMCKKYEDVCKERDRSTALVKTLKEQMNTGLQEDTEDKKQLASVLDEKKMLETQLQRVSDKLLEATTNFTVSQSQHIQELQQWKEQCSGMVDLHKYTRLQIDLVENQRSLREMQDLMSSKEHVASKVFKETSDKHQDMVTSLEDRKQSLEDRLKALQQLLDNHVRKYKEQCDKAERRNLLVVDLYKENAGLMASLANVEEQKRDVVSRCYRLEDQCNELRRTLSKMTRLAVT